MYEIDPLLYEIDKLITSSRMKEIRFIMRMDTMERISKIAAALKLLQTGEYLLGTGPATAGIIPLDIEEVVLGRPATIFEQPIQTAIDYVAIDTLYFTPREISRIHAKVIRRVVDSHTEHIVVDLGSTCGTYVNGVKVDPDGNGHLLSHGDVLSLGPSQTSTYVYYRANISELGSRSEKQQHDYSWVWNKNV